MVPLELKLYCSLESAAARYIITTPHDVTCSKHKYSNGLYLILSWGDFRRTWGPGRVPSRYLREGKNRKSAPPPVVRAYL